MFPILATVNNAAINLSLQVSAAGTHIFISFGYNIGMELLCHMLFLCLTFWETTKMFSTVAVPFFILPAVYWDFYLTTFLPMLIILCFLIKAIPEGIKWLSHYSFDFHFHKPRSYIFIMCLLAICMSHLEKYLPKPMAHFFLIGCYFVDKL